MKSKKEGIVGVRIVKDVSSSIRLMNLKTLMAQTRFASRVKSEMTRSEA